MTVTGADIVNQALQLIGGNQQLVAGAFPNFTPATSATAVAANKIYAACVATVARQFEWDFDRHTEALALSGNTAPYPWAYEYKYPDNALEIWTLFPPTEIDRNNPIPYNFVVANAIVGGQQVRVIHSDLLNARAVFNNNPREDTWDALFREAVVRLLSSELVMATAGKPDVAQGALESYGAFEKLGEARQD